MPTAALHYSLPSVGDPQDRFEVSGVQRAVCYSTVQVVHVALKLGYRGLCWTVQGIQFPVMVVCYSVADDAGRITRVVPIRPLLLDSLVGMVSSNGDAFEAVDIR